MQKPAGWDEIEAKEFGTYEQLELGGHVCQIVKAETIKTSTGKEALKLYLDIADGTQKGFYKRQWDRDTRQQRKWGCTFIQLTEGNSQPYFKGLITAIEKSNPQYKWNWNENSLKNLLIGGVFGREQYRKNDGNLAWFTKCVNLRSIESILAGVEVPADKYLDDSAEVFKPVTDNDDIPWI